MGLESGVKKTWLCILRQYSLFGQLLTGNIYSPNGNEHISVVFVQGEEAAGEIYRLSVLNEKKASYSSSSCGIS